MAPTPAPGSTPPARVSLQTKVVLAALLIRPMYAQEVSQLTKLPQGSVSKIFARLEDQGWLTKGSADTGRSRPPRFYAELTPTGKAATEALGIVPTDVGSARSVRVGGLTLGL